MFQVPEDLQSILNDSPLFSNTSEVTTKEILKRYGDIATRSPAQQPQITNPDTSPFSAAKIPPTTARPVTNGTSNGNGQTPFARAAAPVITHIDTDPYHTHIWPKETSVRHVQAPNNTSPTYGSPPNSNPNSNHNVKNINMTSPQPQSDFANPNSQYHRRAGSADSQSSQNGSSNRKPYRNSGWGKRGGASRGPVGVSGAS